jgi:hypothetical protein
MVVVITKQNCRSVFMSNLFASYFSHYKENAHNDGVLDCHRLCSRLKENAFVSLKLGYCKRPSRNAPACSPYNWHVQIEF